LTTHYYFVVLVVPLIISALAKIILPMQKEIQLDDDSSK